MYHLNRSLHVGVWYGKLPISDLLLIAFTVNSGTLTRVIALMYIYILLNIGTI